MTRRSLVASSTPYVNGHQRRGMCTVPSNSRLQSLIQRLTHPHRLVSPTQCLVQIRVPVLSNRSLVTSTSTNNKGEVQITPARCSVQITKVGHSAGHQRRLNGTAIQHGDSRGRRFYFQKNGLRRTLPKTPKSPRRRRPCRNNSSSSTP
jgi:hypothetical protein